MSNSISAHLKGEDLQAYAALLIDNGFKVSVPAPRNDVNGNPIPITWFVYDLNGNVGNVQYNMDGYSHSMPIKPSREHGSGLIVMDQMWELRLEDAVKTAQAENTAIYGRGTRGLTFPNYGHGLHHRDYIELSKD